MHIDEALNLHPDIHSVIDSERIPVNQKHKTMAAVYRSLLKKGMPTGLSDDKPKKGTSRAVYFPSEPDDINIDGQDTKMHSVLKIAYPGTLDKFNDSGMLFGEHQNIAEGDPYVQRTHSVLRETDDGKYETNEDGILAPVIHSHPDGHYLQMGRVDKLRGPEFRELTKTPEFPKGITHKEFYDTLNHEHAACNGGRNYATTTTAEDRMSDLHEHPLVSAAMNFMFDTQTHPADFDARNMGVWTHPVTNKRHIVISDYGANDNLIKAYVKAREKQFNMRRYGR